VKGLKMFNANDFSDRENLIINFVLEGVNVRGLSVLVNLGIDEIESGLTTGEAVSNAIAELTDNGIDLKENIPALFNANDFSNRENILIEAMQNDVNLHLLSVLTDIALEEIEHGLTTAEAVRIAMFDLKILKDERI
jgi:hypothetical protein